MSNQTSGTPKPSAPKRSAAELRRDIDGTRRELAETLDALEYKLDVPARFGEWAQERKEQLRKATEESPVAILGVAAGAAVVIGGLIAGVVRLSRRGR